MRLLTEIKPSVTHLKLDKTGGSPLMWFRSTDESKNGDGSGMSGTLVSGSMAVVRCTEDKGVVYFRSN